MSGAKVHKLPFADRFDDRRLMDVTLGELRQVIREEIAQALGQREESEEMLTTQQMADRLKKHPDTLCRWAKREGCPAIRNGERDFLWPFDDTLAWMRETFA
jgi:hypothetical protein